MGKQQIKVNGRSSGVKAYAGACALLAALAWPATAQAALVNDYTMADDVWTTPIAPGHFLVDLRTTYSSTIPNFLQGPVVSVVYGVMQNLEVGVWSAYTFTNFRAPSVVAQFNFLNPYVKYQFPAKDGTTAFGLVFGVQVPMVANQEHDVAIEGVAAIPLNSDWSLDLNAGIGRTFVTPATLGHLASAFYYTFPSKASLLMEANVILSSAATPVFGQRIGFQQPFSPLFSADVSLAANEQAGVPIFFTPQLGVTFTL